jgi:non-lysosomal glucosylceramidase
MPIRSSRIFALCLVLALAASAGPVPAPASPPDTGQTAVRIPFTKAELYGLGRPRTFEGAALTEIAFPLGGIGTGTISLGGRGNLRDWEIFNRPGKSTDMPFTFFALYCRPEGEKSVVRVLEGRRTPPFTGQDGLHRAQVPGLPRMEKARFTGEYPFAAVEMEDGKLPLKVTLEAFNPFVPLDVDASGIPAAVLRYRVKNLSAKRVQVTVAGTVFNPVGYEGTGKLANLSHAKLGQNVNQIRKEKSLTGLFMSSRKVDPKTAAFGTLALTTPWKDVTYLSHWVRGDWFDDLQIFWDDFADDGVLKNEEDASPSPDGRSDVGTLGLKAVLEPFGEVVLPFYLSWSFPNFLDYFDVVRSQRGQLFRNQYAERFPDAWAAAAYLDKNLPSLERETRRFHEIFYDSTLPPYVLDALTSQAAIIRTTTAFLLQGNQFFAFEGCNDEAGCCPLNCGHVWNYEQSLAFLYPSLERFMREVDFLTNTKDDGAMIFRTSLPVTAGFFWDFKPAADGSLGKIINLYRDWQISGDMAFLKRLWPKVRKVLDYTWAHWDADKDGLIEGEQHNTYDIEFYGPNSMMGTFYLGALKAAAKMAEAAGDAATAKDCAALFDKGAKAFDATLWNGEYYVQKYDKVMETKYQYGDGCLSDQMLGQWLAMVAGLGRFLPEDRLKTTLGSIYKYNFLTDFSDYSSAQRTYALNDEKGLLLCTWPKGGRPALPFVYSDEVWTGIEYHVASHLIYEGLLDEGLSVAKGVRDRYDGLRRNPWDEVECGHHYARAMSSWGLLTALSGYAYSGVEQRLELAPKIHPEDFRTFWSAGSGWGKFSQKASARGESVELLVAAGGLALREFAVTLPPSLRGKSVRTIQAAGGGSPAAVPFKQEGDRIVLRWNKPVTLKAGEALKLELGL